MSFACCFQPFHPDSHNEQRHTVVPKFLNQNYLHLPKNSKNTIKRIININIKIDFYLN